MVMKAVWDVEPPGVEVRSGEMRRFCLLGDVSKDCTSTLEARTRMGGLLQGGVCLHRCNPRASALVLLPAQQTSGSFKPTKQSTERRSFVLSTTSSSSLLSPL
eukprot:scaffold716_cov364-Pinguiococcus_pyrenoidosus.AAC.2